MYDDLIQLIERSKTAFPKFGNGVSHAAILGAEKALGFPLPESYKWWLLNYGGGQLKGDIVYGIDEPDMGRPDVVKLARINELDALYDDDRLVFSIADAENFYFDTAELRNGEYPVFMHDITQNNVILYAGSFSEFLRKRIHELFGIA